jgi:hypothetical protein
LLDIAHAPEHRGGLIVFFDHADETVRYVVSEVPRIVERPDPQFSLVLFRGDPDGQRFAGGLLQLESTLAPSKAELDKLRNDLAAAGRMPTLAAPDWRAGSVEVAGWLQEDTLMPVSLALGPPSLVGDPLVVLAARLDRQGASLAASALHGDALPVVLLWKLETLGLGGPLGVEVEADLQAMHQRLTAEGALTTPIGRARIAKTWETFAKEQLIRTRVVDESGDVEENRAEAIRRVGEDLTARMFSPFPPPEAPQLLSNDSIASIELSFRLTHRREELEHTRRWSFRERSAVVVTHYAAATLTGLLHGRSSEQFIFTADLGVVRRDVVVRVEPELDAMALSAIEVDLEWPASQELNRTLVLTASQPEQRFIIDRELDEPIRYRVRARFDAATTRAQDRETGWMEASGNLIVISGRRLFPARALTLAIGRGEMDWIDRVQVEVAAPLEPPRSVVFTNTRRTAAANFPGAGSGLLRFSARWVGQSGEPERVVQPFESSDDLVILDSPFGDSIDILVVPLPLQEVLTITLDVRTTESDFADHKQLSWDGDDRMSRPVGLRRLPGSSRHYQYQVTFMRDDGTIEQQPWLETEQRTIVIGATKPVRVISTEVVVLGGGPAGRGSLAIELALSSGENRVRQLLEREADAVRLVLVIDENSPPAQLTAREFLQSGQVVHTHWAPVEPMHVLGLSAPTGAVDAP